MRQGSKITAEGLVLRRRELPGVISVYFDWTVVFCSPPRHPDSVLACPCCKRMLDKDQCEIEDEFQSKGTLLYPGFRNDFSNVNGDGDEEDIFNQTDLYCSSLKPTGVRQDGSPCVICFGGTGRRVSSGDFQAILLDSDNGGSPRLFRRIQTAGRRQTVAIR